ncbi:MAG: AsnC family transcriptional regulator [Proteobacteria bacterium]|nr:AsnC family transcriptional regulator [Pseudomonadota bacterium]MBU1452333.1 AsnC family transcriptional regulator [Pseudomonadota bacterium]MBU2468344.1 AsnC family transcriptional regulator [Pseudomonadota bacterium]MBU2517579.1 AsnC family transcriptional regulator [Pseudomonadota bacterium]
MDLDAIDRKIIARLQGDLPLISRPFAGLAQDLGLEEDEVVRRIQALAAGRVMRRFGATLRHQRSGFASNVMVAWRVPAQRAREVGARLAAFRNVSHCYWREPCEGFSYNLFSMVHGRDDAECRSLVEVMALQAQAEEFELLFSVEELKKTSMRYFDQEGEIHEG